MARYSDSEDESGLSTGLSDNDDFKNRHHCTDIPCLILFLVSLGFFGYLYGWAVVNGDTHKLSHGIDKNGLICGVDEAVKDMPFMYFCPQEILSAAGQPEVDVMSPVCVSECPTEQPVNLTNTSILVPAIIEACGAMPTYNTHPVQNRLCMPLEGAVGDAHEKVVGAVAGFWQAFTEDGFGMKHGWPVIVLTLFMAAILGYAYLFLLRAVARVLIWICTIASVIALVWFGFQLWLAEVEDLPESVRTEDGTHAGVDTLAVTKACAILCWALAGLIIILAFCCGKAVQLSTACVQCATIVMWRMPTLLLAPICKALVKTILFLVLLLGFVHLLSIGEVHGHGFHRVLAFTGEQYGLLTFYMFVALWVLAFVSALYEFSIAYAVARYYMTPEDDTGVRPLPCCGVKEGFCMGITKHCGSLAFGSCIIALLQLAQKIMEYLEYKNKQGANNAVISCMLRTCVCVCKCVEKILKFINKNVYIDIAINSDNFCQGIRNVMHVIIDFGPAMAILNAATYIFQLVGMASITALCGVIAWAILHSPVYSDPDQEWHVESPEVTTGVCVVIAFMVSYTFMSIFDVCTDTLLYCFADDKRNNNGQVTTAPADFVNLYDQADQVLAKQKSTE